MLGISSDHCIQLIASITLDSSQNWIKANLQQMGFYRVNYDVDNWNSLIAYLKAGDWTVGYLCGVFPPHVTEISLAVTDIGPCWPVG